MQLSIQGKGGKARQVLLPDMRGDADANDPVFASRKGGHLTERAVRRGWIAAGHGGPRCQPAVDAGANDPVFASRKGGHLTERAVNGMVKRTARKAGISEAVSPHWLRHAHGSHAIDRGASLPEVQSTLGHGNIATTWMTASGQNASIQP